MTDLVERYLAAVERRLPKETAKDIIAELREALSAQIEAREAALGRATDADEVASILKAYGHPVVVAARYAGHDYVIGPGYAAWYWHVQRIAVGLAIVITFGIVAIRALASEEPVTSAIRGMTGAFQAAVFAFGVVTLLFVLAERRKFDMKWAQRWNPKDLPREHMRQPRSLFESAIALAFDIVFIMFWLRLIPLPNELPLRTGASVAIELSSAWEAVYWPVLVLALLVAVGHTHDLVRPAWSRVRSALSILGYAGGLAVLWFLFRAQPLVEVRPQQGTDPVELERAAGLVESVLVWSLGVAAVIWSIAMSVEIWRQLKASRPSGGVAPLMA